MMHHIESTKDTITAKWRILPALFEEEVEQGPKTELPGVLPEAL